VILKLIVIDFLTNNFIDNQIIHCDLRVEDIMWRGGIYKIIDFKLAKHFSTLIKIEIIISPRGSQNYGSRSNQQKILRALEV
jgi:Ser/Thr protein kinase RdoA (MazF antagonist)